MRSKKKIKKPKDRIEGNRIREILKELDMSQIELADNCSLRTPHLCQIINNKVLQISLPIAIRIARELKRPVEEVFIYREHNIL